MDQTNLKQLKKHLEGLGRLRPEAWQHLIELLKPIDLKINQQYICGQGDMAWLSEGLLKQYNSFNRKEPSLVHFITEGQFLFNQQTDPLPVFIAIEQCKLYTLTNDGAITLISAYPELIRIFLHLRAFYERGLEFRHSLTEIRSANERIQMAIAAFKPYLNRISHRDLSEYVNLNYDYFCHIWGDNL